LISAEGGLHDRLSDDTLSHGQRLADTVGDSMDADIWDIDLFDNTAETVTDLQGKGKRVI
jgi:hypothetical protein